SAKNWNDGTANWSPGVWSPAGAPVAGEAVNIVFTDGTPRTVTYNVSAPSLGLLSVDLTGAGTAASTLSILSNFNLSANGILIGTGTLTVNTNEYVGDIGMGAFNQSGTTTHTISNGGSLLVGNNAGGAGGTFALNGGNLSTPNGSSGGEYIGYRCIGSFTQNG